MPDRHTLVTGALGVIGRAVVAEHARIGARVTALSRRPDPDTLADRHLSVDLQDPAGAATVRSELADVTHLVAAAYQEHPSPAELVDANVALLTGALDALRDAGAPLRHVTLYQGGKAYGAHLGVYRSPARETDPRLAGANFYYSQEDALRERAARDSFTFTILRPDIVLGVSIGSPMNLAQTIAVYATLCREQGVPLRFPGTLAGAEPLVNCTDAGLLARATVWAGDAESAAGRTFNTVNGDLLRWGTMFPRLAEWFGMEADTPQPLPLSENMPPIEPLWSRIADREGLAVRDVGDLAGWPFADFIFGVERDAVLDTLALRQAGFADCVRTEESFFSVFEQLRGLRAIP